MPGKKASAKKAREETLKTKRFYEVLSLCGDKKQAARLVGLGMRKAYRALASPDGITQLQKHCREHGTFFAMSKEERGAFLEKCWMFGYMPRVVFDVNTGEPTAEVVYEPIGLNERLKCLDMANKMDGVYSERRVIEDNRKPGEASPEMREKLDEIYGGGSRSRGDSDVIDVEPAPSGGLETDGDDLLEID